MHVSCGSNDAATGGNRRKIYEKLPCASLGTRLCTETANTKCTSLSWVDKLSTTPSCRPPPPHLPVASNRSLDSAHISARLVTCFGTRQPITRLPKPCSAASGVVLTSYRETRVACHTCVRLLRACYCSRTCVSISIC